MTEIKITRRVALDRPYEYYELEATFDTENMKGNKAIKSVESQVAYIRKLTATKEFKEPKIETTVLAKGKGEPKPKRVVVSHETTEDIKIADLKEGDKVNINVRLLKVGDSKSFISKTDGTPGIFCKCDVEDDSGQMKLTLFGDQVALVKNVKRNAMLSIQNGYVKSYQDKLEMSVGQYGSMEVVYNG